MACGWPKAFPAIPAFAHATAFCHAIERAAGVEAPPRARALRTLCLELERLYNHIGDIGAICTDVAFVTANMHAMRLKERVLRVNEQLTGNRLLRGMACLGGVRFDLDADQIKALWQLVGGTASRNSIRWSSSSKIPRPRATGWKTPACSSPKWRATSASWASPGAPPASTTTCAAIFRTPPTTR